MLLLCFAAVELSAKKNSPKNNVWREVVEVKVESQSPLEYAQDRLEKQTLDETFLKILREACTKPHVIEGADLNVVCLLNCLMKADSAKEFEKQIIEIYYIMVPGIADALIKNPLKFSLKQKILFARHALDYIYIHKIAKEATRNIENFSALYNTLSQSTFPEELFDDAFEMVKMITEKPDASINNTVREALGNLAKEWADICTWYEFAFRVYPRDQVPHPNLLAHQWVGVLQKTGVEYTLNNPHYFDFVLSKIVESLNNISKMTDEDKYITIQEMCGCMWFFRANHTLQMAQIQSAYIQALKTITEENTVKEEGKKSKMRVIRCCSFGSFEPNSQCSYLVEMCQKANDFKKDEVLNRLFAPMKALCNALVDAMDRYEYTPQQALDVVAALRSLRPQKVVKYVPEYDGLLKELCNALVDAMNCYQYTPQQALDVMAVWKPLFINEVVKCVPQYDVPLEELCGALVDAMNRCEYKPKQASEVMAAWRSLMLKKVVKYVPQYDVPQNTPEPEEKREQN